MCQGRTRRVGKAALRREEEERSKWTPAWAPEEALAFEEWVEGKKPQRVGRAERRGRRVVLEGEAVKAPWWAVSPPDARAPDASAPILKPPSGDVLSPFTGADTKAGRNECSNVGARVTEAKAGVLAPDPSVGLCSPPAPARAGHSCPPPGWCAQAALPSSSDTPTTPTFPSTSSEGTVFTRKWFWALGKPPPP